LLRTILNLVIPPRCICGQIVLKESQILCKNCWDKFKFSNANCCSICSYPFDYEAFAGGICGFCIDETPHFNLAKYFFAYDKNSAHLITSLKYSDNTAYARTLGYLIAEKILEFPAHIDIVTAVPIHKKRLISRKYNHAALIANHLARKKNIPANNLILLKTKQTEPQANLSRVRRQKNIIGAIEVNPKLAARIKGKNILLVDDVMTTGATANECAKVLRKAGVGQIYVLTAARTILE